MLYNKNGITITVSPDGRNYMVEGGGFPISYHATLDKAVLKVAKHSADRSSDLWIWLAEYETVARVVAISLRANLSHFPSEVSPSTSEPNKCLIDPSMDEEGVSSTPPDASLDEYNTRGDR